MKMDVRKQSRTRVIQCPVCIKDFTWKNNDKSKFAPRIPYLLECNHSVCSCCVHNFIKNKKPFLRCPICRRDSTSLGNLKQDAYLVGMAATHSERPATALQGESPYVALGGEMADLKEKCSHCYLTLPVYRCNSCRVSVCHKCFYKIHPKPDSNLPVPQSAHTPIPLSPLPSYKRSIICTEHSRQFEYHCATCDKYVCSKCVIEGDHKGHHPVAISTKNNALAETVSRLRNEAGKTLQWLKKSKSNVLMLEPILKSECDERILEIQSEFSRLHGMMQKREVLLIRDVKKKYNSDDTPWAKLKNEIGQRIKSVTALYEDAKDAFNDSQYLYDFKDLALNLETVKNVPCYLYKDETDESPEDEIRFCVDLDRERENLLWNVGRIEGEIKTKHRLIPLNQIPAESLESIPESELINSGGSNSPTPSESDVSNDTPSTTANVWKEDLVKVSQVVHPGNFFVIRLAKFRHLQDLNQRINRWCADGAEMFEDPPGKNEFVLCRFSGDGNWYRAKIIQVKEPLKQVVWVKDHNQQRFVDGESVFDVFYVDYGNSETVRLSNMRKIHSSFLNVEEMGMKCALHDIVPTSEEGWSADAISLMLRLSADALFRLQIFEQAGDVTYVDLRSDSSQGVVSVREWLVSLEVACFESPKSASFSATSQIYQIDGYCATVLPPESALRLVAVHHVNNPDSFFVQLMDSWSECRKMYLALKAKYDKQPPKTVYCATPGMPGVICDPSESWQRVCLIRTIHGKKVELRLVDTGKIIIMNQSDFLHIDKEFVPLPPQAIECKLDDVMPLVRDRWNAEAKLCMTGFRKTKPRFKIYVKEKMQDKLSVVLYVVEDKHDLCVNAVLVENGAALSSGPNSQITRIYRGDSAPIPSNDQMVIRKAPRQNVLLASIERPLVDSGFLDVEGNVSFAESPSCFYIQPASPNKLKVLERLMDVVNKTFNESIPEEGIKWQKGADCIAYAKAEWRRGKIVEINEKRAKIFCIDYGNTEVVSIDSLRVTQKRFCLILPYAVRCHLANITPAGDKGSWSSIACESLNEIINEHNPFQIVQLGPEENGSRPVELYFEYISISGALAPTVRESKGVGELLFEKGFALPNRKKISEKGDNENLVEKPLENVEKPLTSGGDVKDLTLTLSEASTDLQSTKTTPRTSPRTSPKTSPKKKKIKKKKREKVTKPEIKNESPSEKSGSEIKKESSTEKSNSEIKSDTDSSVCVPLRLDYPPVYSQLSVNTSSEISVEQTGSDDLDLDSFEKINMDVPKKKWKRIPLPKLREFDAILTCVDYDGYIYLHNVERSETLTVMRNFLDAAYRKTEPDQHTDSYWFPGEPCIVRYKVDNMWYRGVVQETDVKTTSHCNYKVFFIDYGNSEMVSYYEMRKKLHYTDKTIQSYKCQLCDVEPATENGMWDEVILQFINKTYVDKKVKVTIRELPTHGQPIQVSIAAADGGMSENILRFENVRLADSSRFVDLPFVLDYPFEDQDFEMPYPNFRLPRLHEYVKCLLLSYESPASFWIQKVVVDPTKSPFQRKINSELDTFYKMSLKMSEHLFEYELVENPKLGEAVCCIYSYDSSPYRGVITGCTRNSEDKNDVQYSVLFVDNGARESYRKEKIRRLPDKYLNLPMQAVFCKLHQVRLAEGEKRNIAEERLKELIGDGHYYNAVLKILDDPVEIDLTYHTRIRDVGYFCLAYQHLIDHGLMSLVRDKNGNE